MPKLRQGKTVKSISFDPEVAKFLEHHCRKEGIKESPFVNALVKKAVMSEYEFYRQLASHHSSEMFKYKTLADTAVDKPE